VYIAITKENNLFLLEIWKKKEFDW